MKEEEKNKKSIFTRESQNNYISPDSMVKVYQYADCPYVTATAMSYKVRKNKNNWVKISSKEYQNKITNEIKQYDVSSSSRIDNIQSIKRSQARLVHYIRNNYSNPKRLKFHIVLTFKVPVYDYDIAMNYWKSFRDRFRHKYKHIQFIAIFEYYTKGKYKNAIHIHLLLLPLFYHITREVISHYWNYGYVHFKEFNAETATYFVKSNTLHLYPKGKRLYVKSRLIKMPVPKEMKLSTFQKKMENYDCISQKSIDLVASNDADEKVINKIIYYTYKKREE